MLHWLRHLWDIIFNAVKGFFSSIDSSITHYAEELTFFEDTITQVKQQLRDFKDWQFDPDWGTHVIVPTTALQHIIELKDMVVDTFHDRFDTLAASLNVIKNLVESSHQPPPEGADEAGGALANLSSKLASLTLAIHSFNQAFRAAVDLIQVVDDVKSHLQSMDTLFLSHANARTTVTDKHRTRLGLTGGQASAKVRHEKKRVGNVSPARKRQTGATSQGRKAKKSQPKQAA